MPARLQTDIMEFVRELLRSRKNPLPPRKEIWLVVRDYFKTRIYQLWFFFVIAYCAASIIMNGPLCDIMSEYENCGKLNT